MSLRTLRVVHSPYGGCVRLVEHARHGLVQILEAEKDGFSLIQIRRVPERDRALKLRGLDGAERILHAEKPTRPPKPPRRRLGKAHRRACGGGA